MTTVLTELEAKRAKVAAGPWRSDGWQILFPKKGHECVLLQENVNFDFSADLDYIVTLVNAAPRLLAGIKKAREELRKALNSPATMGIGDIEAISAAYEALDFDAAATSPDVPR